MPLLAFFLFWGGWCRGGGGAGCIKCCTPPLINVFSNCLEGGGAGCIKCRCSFFSTFVQARMFGDKQHISNNTSATPLSLKDKSLKDKSLKDKSLKDKSLTYK